VDEGNDVGQYSSIAISTDGTETPYISYYDSWNMNLKFSYKSGTSWISGLVDDGYGNDIGEYTSISFGSDYVPHISYYDATSNELWHAEYTGGSWAKDVADGPDGELKYAKWEGDEWEITALNDGSGDVVGRYTSIALDSYNRPRISYYDATLGDLKYAKQLPDDTWTFEQVDDGAGNDVGRYSSLVLDSNDIPHISYYDATLGDLNYAYWDDSPPTPHWVTTPVDENGDVGQYSSLALDPNDDYNPHIGYYDATSRDLKHSYHNGIMWQSQALDGEGEVGKFCSIAVDANNNAYVSYKDNTNERLKFVTAWEFGSWSYGFVDQINDVGQHSSIAVDSDNNPHVSYYDATTRDLKYAKWIGDPPETPWQIHVVDNGNGNDVGKYSSLVLDSNDIPHISYYDATDGNLKYAKWTGSDWYVYMIDDRDDRGQYTSIAIDSGSNHLHISYYDATAGNLRHAWYNGHNWGIEPVDEADDVGKFSSIAVDSLTPSYRLHISYYDQTNQRLKYITGWPSASWDPPEIVDTGNDVGQYSSIAVDSSLIPYISYYDATLGNLKYAERTTPPPQSGSWGKVPVDETGDVGQYSSLALDPNDDYNPHITYYDASLLNLKHAYHLDGVWYLDPLDDGLGNDVGKYSSLAIGSNSGLYCSYYDATGHWFKHCKSSVSTEIGFVQRDELLSYPWWGEQGRIRFGTASGPDISGDSQYVQVVYSENAGQVGDLKYAYAWWNDPLGEWQWQIELVDWKGIVGWDTSIALDSNNIPHISYYDYTNGALKYAKWTGDPPPAGPWMIEVVDDDGDVGMLTSIALDSGNRPHISYVDVWQNLLKYAWRDDTGVWYPEYVLHTIGGNQYPVPGRYNSLALDPSDNPHISFYVPNPYFNLQYAYHDGSQWNVEVVDTATPEHNSIALDATNDPHISHFVWTTTGLYYSYWDDETDPLNPLWVKESVDLTYYVGTHNSIVLTSNEKARISYFEQNNGVLKFAYKGNTQWHDLVIDDSPGRTGLYTSLALKEAGDGNKKVYHYGISYFDETNGDLKYAYCNDTVKADDDDCDQWDDNWDFGRVDWDGHVGLYTSLDFEPYQDKSKTKYRPHISYYEETSGNGILHKRSSSSGGEVWTPEALISEKMEWGPRSPEVDVSGENVHVVWEDYRNIDTDGAEIYYQRSTDSGETWPGPGTDVRISDDRDDSNEYDTLPKLSVSGATVNVVWQRRHNTENHAEVMYDFNFQNGGSSGWNPDDDIAPDPPPAPPYHALMPDISAIGNDRHVVWAYGYGGETGIPVAHRIDEISEVTSHTLMSKEGTSTVYAGSSLYVIGGYTGAGYSDEVVEVDPFTGAASVVCYLSDGVAYTSAIWSGGDYIFAFGGQTSAGYVDTIWKIDLSGPSGPSCGTSIEYLDRVKAGTSAVYDGGLYAYIFGGFDGTNYFDEILEFDVANEQIAVHSAILASERAFTSAVWDYNQGKAFIFGGTVAGSPVGIITAFDPVTGSSDYVNAGLYVPRAKTAAVFDGRYAYIFGGASTSGSLDEIVRFNPNGDWTEGVQLMCMPLPDELEGLSAVVSTVTSRGPDNGIFIIGGKSDTVYKDKVWKYYPSYWEP
jgi:hypothetical protein